MPQSPRLNQCGIARRISTSRISRIDFAADGLCVYCCCAIFLVFLYIFKGFEERGLSINHKH